MPEDFGDDDRTAPGTMRGRDWPAVRQYCVFLENRVGSLHELLRGIERDDLHVLALSVVDTSDFAVVRIIVDNPERGLELLNLGGFTFVENDIMAVELPDETQPYVEIVNSLMRAEINVQYAYPILARRGPRGAIAVYVEDIDQAIRVLKDYGHTLLTENDLLEGDGFF